MTHATVGTLSLTMSELAARDPAALAVLLRGDARVGTRRVDERDDREAVPVGQLHRAHGLPVPLRVGHAEVAVRPLADVPTLLVADDHDGATVEASRGRRRSPGRPRAPGRRGARRSRRRSARRSRACKACPDAARARRRARRRPRSAPRSSRSSCRLRRDISPETPTPRRSGRSRSFARRSFSRSCSTWLAGDSLIRRPLQLFANIASSRPTYGRSSARGTIASTWPKRAFDSASPKSSGSFSRVVCWTTRGPVNASSAPGSATMTSPRLAKLARTPAVVGWVMIEMKAQRASRSSSTAHTVFGSCIRERMPSCMRAPPEAVTQTSGTSPRAGALARARELLADGASHRAAHEREVHDGELARPPLDRRRARDERVAEAGRHLGLRQPVGVGPQVEEAERVGRAQVGILLDERAAIGELGDPLARADREVVAAVGTDAHRRLELVVPVVRVAPRAGVRMPLPVPLGALRVAARDGDVDAALHDRAYLTGFPSTGRPRP